MAAIAVRTADRGSLLALLLAQVVSLVLVARERERFI